MSKKCNKCGAELIDLFTSKNVCPNKCSTKDNWSSWTDIRGEMEFNIDWSKDTLASWHNNGFRIDYTNEEIDRALEEKNKEMFPQTEHQGYCGPERIRGTILPFEIMDEYASLDHTITEEIFEKIRNDLAKACALPKEMLFGKCEKKWEFLGVVNKITIHPTYIEIQFMESKNFDRVLNIPHKDLMHDAIPYDRGNLYMQRRDNGTSRYELRK